METKHDSWFREENYEDKESDVENPQSEEESEISHATDESCPNAEHSKDSDSTDSDNEDSDNYTYDEVRAI